MTFIRQSDPILGAYTKACFVYIRVGRHCRKNRRNKNIKFRMNKRYWEIFKIKVDNFILEMDRAKNLYEDLSKKNIGIGV